MLQQLLLEGLCTESDCCCQAPQVPLLLPVRCLLARVLRMLSDRHDMFA